MGKRENIYKLITILFCIILSTFLIAVEVSGNDMNTVSDSADVIVYGATSAGISAAIQVARMGKKVLIVNPDGHIGGMTTGGLGQTDIGDKRAIGGIAREFYRKIKDFYSNSANWVWQQQSQYKDGGQTQTLPGEEVMWTFEPHAATKVFHDFLLQHNISVVSNERLDLNNGVRKLDKRIVSVLMESGKRYSGGVFIDATYEGDLMAGAGVTYTVGREENSRYGETYNGIRSGGGDFKDGVDPYILKGDANSGLLPGITPGGPGIAGTGDKGVQAYCFRMCLTDHPANRIPFKKPEGYNELVYELLFRNYEAGEKRVPWINSSMPNRKTDTNNNNYGFSTDNIGQNHTYPESNYQQRDSIIKAHLHYQQGLMWTLANHPRVPESVRTEVSKWGVCSDEFTGNNGWPTQLYVREARRMISSFVITQYQVNQQNADDKAQFSVGLGSYTMDSHHIKRYVNNKGYVKNEGNFGAAVSRPYPIDYRSIVPKRTECANLLVPVCLSASHVALGSIRMEPVYMILGQSAGAAACLSIDKNTAVQDLEYSLLKDVLKEAGQILAYPPETNPDSTILDNTDSRYTGTWKSSTFVSGFYGKDYVFCDPAPFGTHTVTWLFNITVSGRYEIAAIWNSMEGYRTDNAKFTISSNGQQWNIYVNQLQNGGKFNALDTLDLTPGELEVKLTSSPNGIVIADAVRYTRLPLTASVSLTTDGIRIFPNPVSSILNISCPECKSSEADISLYDLKGVKLFGMSRITGLPARVDVSSFKPGVYLIRVMDRVNGIFRFEKIIKK